MKLREDFIEADMPVVVYDSIHDIEPATWDHINGELAFYQKHHFLSVIEEIHKDIQFRYVLVKKEDKIVVAYYMLLLDFSFRNLVNYSRESKGLKNRFKKFMAQKNTKLLNLGNVFFTGDKGMIATDESIAIPLLPQIFKVVKKTFNSPKPKASLIANIYMEESEKCINFCNSAFHPFITEPDMFLTVDPNWKTFEDYMEALSSKYRVRAKKVLNVSQDITRRELSMEDILSQKESLLKLYNNVVNHVAFNMATLNIDFFEKMKEIYDGKCTLYGYYKDGVMVSFACLFHVDPNTLHVHYIGLDYEINKEFKLYNRMLLDFVRFAIERKVQKVHFGRTATEIKTTIGAEPNPLQAYLKMNSRVVNATLPYFLKRIKPQEYTVRNPFK